MTFIARFLILAGRVQGVGFRPFVYRLATRLGLTGWVKNLSGQVAIWIQGEPAAVRAFLQAVTQAAPPLAQPYVVTTERREIQSALTTFSILDSDSHGSSHVHVPPDFFTCSDCLSELQDVQDRRYRYPFVNCTQCGPRYTLIKRLPYDRPNTSMSAFPLCPECVAEYHNPGDRRFHAQPLACPVCGPQLQFCESPGQFEGDQALSACVEALRVGKIVAVKGVGGYHLLCDAGNNETILRLRRCKPRPDKPLAVMLPLESSFDPNFVEPSEVRLLHDPSRPIVLLDKSALSFPLSQAIAPGLNEVGVMLPYSPLHHLLLHDFAAPLVATSANVSGEPVLTENLAVEQRLSSVADAFLHHNRPIIRPADDSVLKRMAQKMRPIRLGRGVAPLELSLPRSIEKPTLAVGGHLKNTVALAWQNRVVISPHIGDLEAPRSVDVFVQVIKDLQELYDVQAQQVVCDAHPSYASTRWARQSGLPVIPIFHHQAHAAALVGEFPRDTPWLIFTWDGVGLGADNTLWGGETLYGQPGQWKRVAHLRPFRPVGGDKAAREPWRSAAALCWEVGREYSIPHSSDDVLLHQAWQRQLNCPVTTAAGRLFDAAAALVEVRHTVSFEGQAPMLLEALCTLSDDFIDLPLQKTTTGMWQIDWAVLLPSLMDISVAPGVRATLFHNSLAHTIVNIAQQVSVERPVSQVGLCGGVFQNRYLTERAVTLLADAGFQVFLPERLPTNDASISFGQIITVAFGVR